MMQHDVMPRKIRFDVVREAIDLIDEGVLASGFFNAV
jgi:hypothetical protein